MAVQYHLQIDDFVVRRVLAIVVGFDPEQQLDHGPDRIAALARLACETVRQLAAAE